MRTEMPDSQFLDLVNLNYSSMRRARQLAGRGRIKAAACEAARAMFARPLRHPVREAEIPALARIIKRRWPAQVDYLTRLAENYLLVEPARSGLVCGENLEEEHALYRSCWRPWKRRGDSLHTLARLYRLTGRRKYLRVAVRDMRRIVAAMPALPDGEHVGAFNWHPHGDIGSHEPGHVAEKVCHALPYLRADLSAEEALLFAKALLAMAEFNFRTCRLDVPHNITLHMLAGCLLVGLCLPALKPARKWVRFIQRRLETDFAGRPFATPDGYMGEGFSYQNVNQNLMQVCLRYLLAAGRKVSPCLIKSCERSFEFAAAITRTDGKYPLFGDCHSHGSHEHYIHAHEMLHYAAAFFRRADFKAAAGSPYGEDPMEYNLWLMGLDGLAWWDATRVAPRSERRLRPHDMRASGFQFFGLGRGLNGHSGMFACAATHNHAHRDFGSIDLYGLGRPLLTDSSVTSYGEDSYRSERAHNTVVPVRRSPLGPRLDRPDHVRALFVVHEQTIQAACMEHDLYETHRVRRTVCLVNAGAVLSPADRSRTAARSGAGRDWGRDSEHGAGASAGRRSGDMPAFWLVVDHVERSYPYPADAEPQDFLETYFHFAAPQTQLGRDRTAMTCWSRFDPGGAVLLRYAPADAAFKGKPQRVRLADYLRAYEDVTSDANIQVTAVPPKRRDYIMDMRLFHGFTGDYHGRVKRPAMAYRWRGLLPFDAAYVLVPFRGVRSRPYAKVAGQWTGTGDLAVTVHSPQGSIRVTTHGLQTAKPRFAVTRQTAGG
jgi:hypothetical protein